MNESLCAGRYYKEFNSKHSWKLFGHDDTFENKAKGAAMGVDGGWRLSWLHDRCLVVSEETTGNNAALRVIWKVFSSATFSAAMEQSWSARFTGIHWFLAAVLSSLLLWEYKCAVFWEKKMNSFNIYLYLCICL